MRRRGRQRGWVGLIVILLALAIVAWVAKDALKQYGLMSGLGPAPTAAPAKERAMRGPGVGVTEASPDLTTVTPAPVEALQRARGVESMVKDQAAEQTKRIDDATK
jgi:hypothetical protein